MAKHRRRKHSHARHSSPPSSHRGRKHRGGGKGASIKSLLSTNTILSGAMVGAAVVGSGIAVDQVMRRFLPQQLGNIYIVTAAQLALGVAGAMALKKVGGLSKYAEAWMTGSTASAAVNLYGYFMQQRALQANNAMGPQPLLGLRGRPGLGAIYTRNGVTNLNTRVA